jgi:hypothetical protein
MGRSVTRRTCLLAVATGLFAFGQAGIAADPIKIGLTANAKAARDSTIGL